MLLLSSVPVDDKLQERDWVGAMLFFCDGESPTYKSTICEESNQLKADGGTPAPTVMVTDGKVSDVAVAANSDPAFFGGVRYRKIARCCWVQAQFACAGRTAGL